MTVLPGTVTPDTCRLAYENLLERGEVTASGEASEFPVENCFNWKPHDFFKPAVDGTINIDLVLDTPQTADYFGFFNQDLYTQGATIKLQYHDGSGYVDCFNPFTPADNSPQVFYFDAVSASLWRVVIECTEVFGIGVISFGQYLALPYGMYLNWTPPQLADDAELSDSVSERGSFLGRSVISQGVKTSIELQYASDGWVRGNWPDFRDHAKSRPFFWTPNVLTYPNESVFCWVEGKVPMPRHTQYKHMGCSIPIRGMIE
jgi:hypothetical protein